MMMKLMRMMMLSMVKCFEYIDWQYIAAVEVVDFAFEERLRSVGFDIH